MKLPIFFFLLLALAVKSEEEVCDKKDGGGGGCHGGARKSAKRFVSNDGDVNAMYDALKEKLEGIKKSCGEVCETREEKERVRNPNGVWTAELEKDVDCPALFSNPDIDSSSVFMRPPRRIPKFLLDDFSYQGRVPAVASAYIDESPSMSAAKASSSDSRVVWTEGEIEAMVEQMRGGDFDVKMYSAYNVRDVHRHLEDDKISGGVKGKKALVIGTQKPWVEALLILNGAASVTTLEYHEIESRHPKVKAVMPEELSKMFLDGTLEKFDIMVSFSSLEHSGLGRYGDELNPWGDLITMARTWCMMKPGGRVVVGVPVHPEERILYNNARVYSKVLLKHLFANWKQIHTAMDLSKKHEPAWAYQPLFVAEKVEAKEAKP